MAEAHKKEKELKEKYLIALKNAREAAESLPKIPDRALMTCPPKRAQKICDHLLGLER